VDIQLTAEGANDMSSDPTLSYRNLVVLVVDDFTTIRRVTRNILRDLGFEAIYEAEDGDVATRILGTKKVDLIISDWNMPKMTGLELLKWVRSHSETQDIPFLMVTAENEKQKVVDAVKAKVNQYIVKPFTAAILAEKLKYILKQ
jgi:two-component system, chemotaxis family, chemotaxis protein CheY